MNPMPSGARADEGGEGADAAAVGAGGGPERADMSGGAGEAFGRARAGAEAAMETAAAVLHGGLAALAAAAGAGAAARGGQEIAGAVAVLQMPATIGREGGGQGRGENRTMEPMPSGDRLTRSRGADGRAIDKGLEDVEHCRLDKVLASLYRTFIVHLSRAVKRSNLLQLCQWRNIIPKEDYIVEYTDEFGVWWDSLTEAQQEDVTAIVQQRRGPTLPFPYSSGIVGSCHPHMRELRIQSGGRPLRIFHAFDPRRAAILLIGRDKTGDKRFYEKFIPIADRLYDEHLEELRKEVADGR